MDKLILTAIPFFFVSMALEALALRHAAHEHEDDGPVGYERSDTRTSLAMGIGHLGIGAAWKLVMTAIYAAVYVVSPLKLPTEAWWTWVILFFADDFAYYAYHRGHHRIRLFWATHVVHHSSQHYNLSTALRQDWTPFSATLFWLPSALFFPPWMIFLALAWNLLYQFTLHTEAVDRYPRPIELDLQHAQPPPRAPRLAGAVPGPQLRGHPDHLGPDVRHVRARGRARAVRPDEEHRDVQPGEGRLPRVRLAVARRARAPGPGRRGWATCSAARGGSLRARRRPTSGRRGA